MGPDPSDRRVCEDAPGGQVPLEGVAQLAGVAPSAGKPCMADHAHVLCMAIVGGAVVPFAQGLMADTIGLQWSFFVPAACYTFNLYLRLKYARMYVEPTARALNRKRPTLTSSPP